MTNRIKIKAEAHASRRTTHGWIEVRAALAHLVLVLAAFVRREPCSPPLPKPEPAGLSTAAYLATFSDFVRFALPGWRLLPPMQKLVTPQATIDVVVGETYRDVLGGAVVRVLGEPRDGYCPVFVEKGPLLPIDGVRVEAGAELDMALEEGRWTVYYPKKKARKPRGARP